MNPILALGQIIVSIALIAAILLQARGTGLSGTFGGDSAVYRSRRGVVGSEASQGQVAEATAAHLQHVSAGVRG